METKLSFAEALRQHRRERGLTQAELAERAHLSERAISEGDALGRRSGDALPLPPEPTDPALIRARAEGRAMTVDQATDAVLRSSGVP